MLKAQVSHIGRLSVRDSSSDHMGVNVQFENPSVVAIVTASEQKVPQTDEENGATGCSASGTGSAAEDNTSTEAFVDEVNVEKAEHKVDDPVPAENIATIQQLPAGTGTVHISRTTDGSFNTSSLGPVVAYTGMYTPPMCLLLLILLL